MTLVPGNFSVSWAGIIFQCAEKCIKAISMFKIVHDLTPHCLRECFESRSTRYILRNLENTLFVLNPITGKDSISYNDGAMLYEQYPL